MVVAAWGEAGTVAAVAWGEAGTVAAGRAKSCEGRSYGGVGGVGRNEDYGGREGHCCAWGGELVAAAV